MGEETSPCLLTLTTFFRWKRVVSKVGDFYDPQCHLLMACYQSDFEMVKFLLACKIASPREPCFSTATPKNKSNSGFSTSRERTRTDPLYSGTRSDPCSGLSRGLKKPLMSSRTRGEKDKKSSLFEYPLLFVRRVVPEGGERLCEVLCYALLEEEREREREKEIEKRGGGKGGSEDESETGEIVSWYQEESWSVTGIAPFPSSSPLGSDRWGLKSTSKKSSFLDSIFSQLCVLLAKTLDQKDTTEEKKIVLDCFLGVEAVLCSLKNPSCDDFCAELDRLVPFYGCDDIGETEENEEEKENFCCDKRKQEELFVRLFEQDEEEVGLLFHSGLLVNGLTGWGERKRGVKKRKKGVDCQCEGWEKNQESLLHRICEKGKTRLLYFLLSSPSNILLNGEEAKIASKDGLFPIQILLSEGKFYCPSLKEFEDDPSPPPATPPQKGMAPTTTFFGLSPASASPPREGLFKSTTPPASRPTRVGSRAMSGSFSPVIVPQGGKPKNSPPVTLTGSHSGKAFRTSSGSFSAVIVPKGKPREPLPSGRGPSKSPTPTLHKGVSQGSKIEIPQGGKPPVGGAPGTPKGSAPGTPKGKAPGTPKGGPPTPKGSSPSTPKGSAPNTPKGGPPTPKGNPPSAPKGSAPSTPKGNPPSAPKGSAPSTPGTPKGVSPGTPKGAPAGYGISGRSKTVSGADVFSNLEGGAGGIVLPTVAFCGEGSGASESEERAVFSFLLNGVDLEGYLPSGVENGEDAGRVLKGGERLLHTSVRARCFVLLEILLEGGVSSKQETKEGKTIDDIAAELFLYPSDFLFFESTRLLLSRYGFTLTHTLPRPMRGSRLPAGQRKDKKRADKSHNMSLPEGAPPTSPTRRRAGPNTNTSTANTTENDTDMDEITDSDFTLSSPPNSTMSRLSPMLLPSAQRDPSPVPSGLPLRKSQKSSFDSHDSIFASPGKRPKSRPSSFMGGTTNVDNWPVTFTSSDLDSSNSEQTLSETMIEHSFAEGERERSLVALMLRSYLKDKSEIFLFFMAMDQFDIDRNILLEHLLKSIEDNKLEPASPSIPLITTERDKGVRKSSNRISLKKRRDHESRKSVTDGEALSLPESSDSELSLADIISGPAAALGQVISSPSIILKGGSSTQIKEEPLLLPAPHLKTSGPESLSTSPNRRRMTEEKDKEAALFILMQWVLFCGASYDRTDKKFYRFFTKQLSKFAAKLNLIKLKLFAQQQLNMDDHCICALASLENCQKLNWWHKKPSLFSYSIPALACGITFVMFRAYKSLEPMEFHDGFQGANRKRQSPHLHFLGLLFNRLNSLCVNEILFCEDEEGRLGAVEKCIDLAYTLKKMNNLEGMAAVMSALNSAPITRLRSLWSQVKQKSSKKFKGMGENMAHNLYWEMYRGCKPPLIPWIAPKLRELRYLYDSQSTYKQWEFSDLRAVGKSINDYLQHKSTPYSLEEPEKSLVYLLEGMEDGKEFVGLHYDFSVFEDDMYEKSQSYRRTGPNQPQEGVGFSP